MKLKYAVIMLLNLEAFELLDCDTNLNLHTKTTTYEHTTLII